MKVTVNCVLLIGNREKFNPGHVFDGYLEDFPEDIQNLVKKDSKFLTVVPDLAPKSKPVKSVEEAAVEEAVVEEIAVEEAVVEEVKAKNKKPRAKLKSKTRP